MEECDDQKTEMLEPIFPRNVIELEVGEIQWKCDRVRSRSNGSGSIWRGRATCQGKSHNLRFAALIILPFGYGTPQIWTTLTDMDQKNHPRARVYWKDNSIGRTHVGKFQQIPLYSTYHTLTLATLDLSIFVDHIGNIHRWTKRKYTRPHISHIN